MYAEQLIENKEAKLNTINSFEMLKLLATKISTIQDLDWEISTTNLQGGKTIVEIVLSKLKISIKVFIQDAIAELRQNNKSHHYQWKKDAIFSIDYALQDICQILKATLDLTTNLTELIITAMQEEFSAEQQNDDEVNFDNFKSITQVQQNTQYSNTENGYINVPQKKVRLNHNPYLERPNLKKIKNKK